MASQYDNYINLPGYVTIIIVDTYFQNIISWQYEHYFNLHQNTADT